MTADSPAPGVIDFEPMQPAHFPMLWEWHLRPHVARWFAPWTPATYGEFVEQCTRMVDGLEPQRGYLVLVDGDAVGYIEGYRLDDSPELAGPLALGEDAVGADVFIADPGNTGRGLGPPVVAHFYLRMMEETGLDVGIIDPEIENQRAVRAYEKAGFSFLRDVDTGGRMLDHVMVARRAELRAALGEG